MDITRFNLYPQREITFGVSAYMESPQPRLSDSQVVALREIVGREAIGGHRTEPVDRNGLGYTDLIAVIAIGWDSIGHKQLLLVVTQGNANRGASTIVLTVMPYAAPSSGTNMLNQTDKSYTPATAAMLLDTLAATIEENDELVPPR